MEIIRTVADMKARAAAWKAEGLSIGLVPTMGSLHEGHESLMDAAREASDRVVVSVFVNPIQFGPGEDYEAYPRDLERDARICERHGVDVVFHPEVDDMYAPAHNTFVVMETLTDSLCGASRPGHFRGVCTVVTKLFNIVQPHRAFFGQKDAPAARHHQAHGGRPEHERDRRRLPHRARGRRSGQKLAQRLPERGGAPGGPRAVAGPSSPGRRPWKRGSATRRCSRHS